MKKRILRILITAAAVVSGPVIALGAVAISNAQGQIFTEMALTFAAESTSKIQYDHEPSGSSVFRFGLNGAYSVECQDGSVVNSILPRGASLPENGSAETVCDKIS